MKLFDFIKNCDQGIFKCLFCANDLVKKLNTRNYLCSNCKYYYKNNKPAKYKFDITVRKLKYDIRKRCDISVNMGSIFFILNDFYIKIEYSLKPCLILFDDISFIEYCPLNKEGYSILKFEDYDFIDKDKIYNLMKLNLVFK